MVNQRLARPIVTLVTLAALALAAPARAGILYDTFSFSGDGVTGEGTITTSSTPDPTAPLGDAYDILSISGEVNGEAITGLAGEQGGSVEYSSDGYFIYDNDFYPAGAASAAGGYFDDDGLLLVVGGTDYNLFFDGTNYWYWADQGGGVAVTFTATDPPAPVPEPPSALLFGTMLLGATIFLRRRAAARY